MQLLQTSPAAKQKTKKTSRVMTFFLDTTKNIKENKGIDYFREIES